MFANRTAILEYKYLLTEELIPVLPAGPDSQARATTQRAARSGYLHCMLDSGIHRDSMIRAFVDGMLNDGYFVVNHGNDDRDTIQSTFSSFLM